MNEPPSLVAFLDASVLYPALLRNLLVYFAANDLYQARWSSQVHEEWLESSGFWSIYAVNPLAACCQLKGREGKIPNGLCFFR